MGQANKLKKILKLFIAGGLCLFSFSSIAQVNWVLFNTSIDGQEKHYYEPTTIQNISNKKRVWSYVNVENSKPNQPKSYKAYNEYDCTEKTGVTLELITYTGNDLSGELYTVNINHKKRYIAPGTIENRMLLMLCK
jgi:hypothetical protein